MIALDRKLFLNRRLKTRLDLIRSDLGGKVFFDKQSDHKFRIDKGSKEGEFTVGEQVVEQAAQVAKPFREVTGVT